MKAFFQQNLVYAHFKSPNVSYQGMWMCNQGVDSTSYSKIESILVLTSKYVVVL
jgi:hypothetical protein